MNKKVLMAVPNYYTSVFQVGSHHYARAFGRMGYKVLFISNPISPIHKIFANSEELKEREEIYKSGGRRDGNILYYVPKALFTPYNKPFLSSKLVINNWFKFTYPNLLDYIRRNNFLDVDILWFDSALFWFLIDCVNYKQAILRLADYSKGFNAIPDSQYQKEIYIAEKVDLIIYTAQNLREKYNDIKNKSKMKYVPNGIDWNFFESADKSFPDEFRNIPKPRIIYVGAIKDWFDEDLIFYAAKTLKNFNFILIGPIHKKLKKLQNLVNVHLLGKKSYNEIPKYLYHSDIGIIPFDIGKHKSLVESVHPLKLYEYMACGLPVVSTDWEELRNINSPAYLCKTKEEFVENLKKALDEKGTRKREYIEFARKNSWEKRLEMIMNALEEDDKNIKRI